MEGFNKINKTGENVDSKTATEQDINAFAAHTDEQRAALALVLAKVRRNSAEASSGQGEGSEPERTAS